MAASPRRQPDCERPPIIGFEDAKDLAFAQWSGVSYCMEYDNAYVFGKPNDKGIGRNGPIVALKDLERRVSMVNYLGVPGNPSLIRESCILPSPGHTK